MNAPLPVWMTFKEACLYSRLGHHTIRQLLHQGKIRGRHVGKKWVVSRESIDAFLEEPHRQAKVALDSLRG
jgi:excisionase family DNA binding protein